MGLLLCPTTLACKTASIGDKDTGLAALSSGGTPSTCTAMCPAHIPTMWGSNAPASLVDEGPSQGSLALEDWQPQSRVHLEDVTNHDTATGHVTGPYVYNSIVSLCSSLV